MPHFVTKPTRTSRKYYIFSTAVMAPITEKMYRSEMVKWLKEHDYHNYLDPRRMSEYEDVQKYYDTPGLQAILAKDESMTYWNGSFWYVTEEDGYFV